jgi:hypothetical protein
MRVKLNTGMMLFSIGKKETPGRRIGLTVK